MSEIISFLTSFGFSDFIYFSLLLTLFYIIKFYYNYFTRPNPLSGPIPIPIVGSLWQKICGFSEWHSKNFRKYGNIFEWYFGSYRTIELCKAELIENMNLSSMNSKYLHRFVNAKEFKDYLGYENFGIVLNNDIHKSWKFNRQFFGQVPIFVMKHHDG